MQLSATLAAILSVTSLAAAAPAVLDTRNDPTVCAPGTGYFQRCSNEFGVTFSGCCTQDACSLGYCPSGTTNPPPVTTPETTTTTTTTTTQLPDGQCAPGTGFFQVCGNGFRGCCAKDACTLGYCPSV
jgi:hypothetical protein